LTETAAVRQGAVPMISYENVAEPIDWLTSAFGFQERGDRYAEPDGTVTHAELELDGARVMLGWPGPEYRGPERHAEICDHAREWLTVPHVIDGVLVYVEDVDAHCERARPYGAKILREPQDDRTDLCTARAIRKGIDGCSCRRPPIDGCDPPPISKSGG
jgi:uncharacterized glyoxalase superfamily protein PhnB